MEISAHSPSPQHDAPPPHVAFIAIGANLPSALGEPADTVRAAMDRLGEVGEVAARSSLYRTAPVGYTDQPAFVNAAVRLHTRLAPHALLNALTTIEQALGRDRSRQIPKGPRTIDLDLLLYGDLVLDSEALTLPHPAMHERRFVLEPLAEIAPDWVHPILRRSIHELLQPLLSVPSNEDAPAG
jgi:2-amino-4-hydroxy-6-hydroxymethyldihydropteridine diphosphokinase